jgi:hypothetical protein
MVLVVLFLFELFVFLTHQSMAEGVPALPAANVSGLRNDFRNSNHFKIKLN